jgi:hypothetical protein
MLQADGLALSLRGALERVCIPLARAAAAFVRASGWLPFGFARLDDHARERFGRSGRWVRDLAALGGALDSFPLLAGSLTGDDGGPPIGRVAALAIARVASPVSLDAWVAVARAAPVRDLRAAARAARAAGSSWPPGVDPSGAQEDVASGGAFDGQPEAASGGGPHGVAPDPDDDLSERSLVRIPVPSPVLAAFDEALDLYRCVEGTEASATAFVEAFVAESLTGARESELRDPASADASNDANHLALRAGPGLARVESALARATANWSHLPPSSSASWALALAGVSLARLDRLAREAGTGSPAELDGQIRALLALENDMEGRLGRLLAEMADRGAWPRLRFAGVGHYAEQRLGLSHTSAEDRARAARALHRFPRLRAAYEDGRIGLEVTLLVLRILDDAPVDGTTEAAWLARAEEATVKRLRDEARALRRAAVLGRRDSTVRGAPDPDARAGPAPIPDAGTSAVPAPLAGAGTHPVPAPLADAEWHASLRRAPGTARERLLRFGALAVGWADGAGALPSPDVFLRLRLPHELACDFLDAVEASRRTLSDLADQVPWDEPWPDPDSAPSVLAARTFSTRSRRVPAWVGLLAMIEEFVSTWDGEARAADGQRPAGAAPADRVRPDRAEPERAGPEIPAVPATPRRHGDAVYIRDGWRCSAPGCTSRRNLEDHHLIYRSHQGTDDLSNRTCLCRFHHGRGEHGGLASCKGAAPLGITWRLGRPDLATWYRNERRIGGPA